MCEWGNGNQVHCQGERGIVLSRTCHWLRHGDRGVEQAQRPVNFSYWFFDFIQNGFQWNRLIRPTVKIRLCFVAHFVQIWSCVPQGPVPASRLTSHHRTESIETDFMQKSMQKSYRRDRLRPSQIAVTKLFVTRLMQNLVVRRRCPPTHLTHLMIARIVSAETYEDLSSQSDNYHVLNSRIDALRLVQFYKERAHPWPIADHDNCHFGLMHPRRWWHGIFCTGALWWTMEPRSDTRFIGYEVDSMKFGQTCGRSRCILSAVSSFSHIA